MKNLAQMMKQAQQMQEKMAEMQAALEQLSISGSAGGGMVQVTLTGKGAMTGIKIDPALAVPAEIEVLEDLVIAAVNDARAKVDGVVAAEMSKLTGGLQLPPGLKLPFCEQRTEDGEQSAAMPTSVLCPLPSDICP